MTTTPAIEGWFTTGAEPGAPRLPLHDLRDGLLPAARRASAATPPAPARSSRPSSCPVAGPSGPTPTRSTSRRRRTSRAASPTSPSRSPPSSCPRAWWCSARSPTGYGVDDLRVGAEVELVVETALQPTTTGERTIWRWKPVVELGAGGGPVSRTTSPSSASACTRGASGAGPSSSYGVARRPRRRSPTPGVAWTDVDLVVGGETVRNGYGGYVAGATFAQALGWNGARVATSYAACATGAQAIDTARARILAGLCDVALVVGADTTPKGFLAPNAGERYDDPDWLRFRLLGMTNPAYFALYARRRMDLYGATPEDFAKVKVKNAAGGAGEPERPLPQGGHRGGGARLGRRRRPAAPARHLRHLRRRGRGGAHEHGLRAVARGIASPVRVRAVSTVTPTFPQTVIEMPNFATDSIGRRSRAGDRTFKESIAHAAYEEAGIGPEDVDVAEVYDLSTALELDWYEDIGLCKRGEAERLIRAGDTALGGRVPVNPSGGLACFGEAVPAQALAQVCELTWQLRGQADGPPGRGRLGRASPPTRASSATAPRCCSRPDASRPRAANPQPCKGSGPLRRVRDGRAADPI